MSRRRSSYFLTILWPVTIVLAIGGIPRSLRADDTPPMTAAQQQGAKLLGAVFSGNAAAVEVLLKQGADTEFRRGKHGATPLMQAAENGSPEIVQLLVDHKAKLDPQDTFHGNTPLTLAALHGRLDIVRILVEHGANVNANVTTHGHTFFSSAEGSGPSNPTPLGSAAEGGHVAVIEYLLSKGAKIDGQDSHAFTPLMWASETGGSEAVRTLLRHHANVNFKTDQGDTALNRAANGGRLDVIKVLLEGKADVNINCTEPGHYSPQTLKRIEPDSPIPPRTVVVNGQTVVVNGQLHLEPYCPTPLGSAALVGQTAVIEYLLSKGARIDGRDGISYTPLMWACRGANAVSVKVLLRHGADVTLKTADGKTARSLAAARNTIAVLALLDGAKKE
ncbi:MAG: ankyrin repeat protein 65-like [Chthonomonadales bacterium]|nr:ankyrin repeat protein 65-like [Chthonomonadales bacterium]